MSGTANINPSAGGRARGPFRPAVVALLVLIGAGAFMLMLYAIGQGWNGGGDERNGGEHGASTSLTGFAGLARLLEETGHEVELSRNEGNRDDYGLLILTPPLNADPDEIQQILDDRRYIGPTMLILPKWFATPVPDIAEVESEEGWVMLGGAFAPRWFDELDMAEGTELINGTTKGWSGYEASGTLAQAGKSNALIEDENNNFEPYIIDSEEDFLAADFFDEDSEWAVLVVFEPDLMNNMGLADEERAKIALQLIYEASYYEDRKVIFDLTLPGLGKSENLLTLAFQPPFLAATLTLILAALIIFWRSFHRFGPPIAEAASIAQGKKQLARNGAALIARMKRWHLLGDPYANLVAARISKALGLTDRQSEDQDKAIDRALERSDHQGPSFSQCAHELRNARKPGDILRAARKLRIIERMLIQ